MIAPPIGLVLVLLLVLMGISDCRLALQTAIVIFGEDGRLHYVSAALDVEELGVTANNKYDF